ncbi:MAG: maleate cis-trans isomerase family protein [Alphaproteobacteria bacterium]
MAFTMRGWRGRIGLVAPDDGINDDEYWNYLPEGVSLLIGRFTTSMRDDSIAPHMVDAYGDLSVLERAADVLKITRPSAVVFGCTSCSFIRGVGWDLKQGETIGRVCGCPGTTVSTAIVAALRTMGVKSVSMGAPYPESVTEKFATFLRDSGFKVCAWKALGMTTEWDIGNASPSVWYDLAREVDRPEAEAVVISCTGVRTADILTVLEADIGKPVVAAPQAMMWHPLQLMKVDATRPDRGRLLAEHGNAFQRPEAPRAQRARSA